jgi:hypothetical protein
LATRVVRAAILAIGNAIAIAHCSASMNNFSVANVPKHAGRVEHAVEVSI